MTGMEADAAIRIGPRRPVLQISLYMDTDGRELRPYLMMPSRMEIDLKQMILIRGCEEAVRQLRDLRPRLLLR